jgi:23S rRNA pseudouridine1911/1915/1917 synthase
MVQKLNIIFEDNKIIVVVKPPGILSQSDITQRPDMLTMLKVYIKDKYNKPGNVYLGLVHRLDREVGGLMVFARNSKAAAFLSEQIREHQFAKKYLALVENWNLPDNGELQDYLLKDEYLNKTSFAKADQPQAKFSSLRYKVLSKNSEGTIVEIDLQTGRSHQIRAQFGLRGMPLLGDGKYGSQHKSDKIRLWAYALEFKESRDGEVLKFENRPEWIA